MGIALSGGPNVFTSFSGASTAAFLGGLAAALQAANWAVFDTTAGGYKLRGRSPQRGGRLTVGVSLYAATADPAGPRVQFFSDVAGSTTLGFPHPFAVGAGLTYQLVANPCQFFLSRVGGRYDAAGASVCGGIPYITTDPCPEMKDGVDVTEAWWSMGDGYGSPFFASSSLRGNFLLADYSRLANVRAGQACEGCFNGAYCGPGDGYGIGVARVLCLTSPDDRDQSTFYYGSVPSKMLLWDDSSFDEEALLAWGENAASTARLRGQVWDSVIKTAPAAMDSVLMIDGRQWVNYTDNCVYGALYLLAGPAVVTGARGNYAY